MSKYGEPWKASQKPEKTMALNVEPEWGTIEPDEEEIKGSITQRVVACVNACAGISDEGLSKGVRVNNSLYMPLLNDLVKQVAKACPFCSSKEGLCLDKTVWKNQEIKGCVRIYCHRCGASGPMAHYMDLTDATKTTLVVLEAIAAWNNRLRKETMKGEE